MIGPFSDMIGIDNIGSFRFGADGGDLKTPRKFTRLYLLTAHGVNTCVGEIDFLPSILAAKFICKIKTNIVPVQYINIKVKIDASANK